MPRTTDKTIQDMTSKMLALLKLHGPLTVDNLSKKLVISRAWARNLAKSASESKKIQMKTFKTPSYRVGIGVAALPSASEQEMRAAVQECPDRWGRSPVYAPKVKAAS